MVDVRNSADIDMHEIECMGFGSLVDMPKYNTEGNAVVADVIDDIEDVSDIQADNASVGILANEDSLHRAAAVGTCIRKVDDIHYVYNEHNYFYSPAI